MSVSALVSLVIRVQACIRTLLLHVAVAACGAETHQYVQARGRRGEPLSKEAQATAFNTEQRPPLEVHEAEAS